MIVAVVVVDILSIIGALVILPAINKAISLVVVFSIDALVVLVRTLAVDNAFVGVCVGSMAVFGVFVVSLTPSRFCETPFRMVFSLVA